MGNDAANFNYSGRTSWYPRPYNAYAHATVTVSGGENIRASEVSNLFSRLTTAYEILIRNGGEDVMVKFNSADNDAIPIKASDNFGTAGYNVHEMFLTTSGGGTIEIYTMGWK
jgi:hypothetical protein